MTADAGGRLDRGAVLRRHERPLLVEPVPDVGLLDGPANYLGKGRLPAGLFNCALECIHVAQSTKHLVSQSTSFLVVQSNKDLCRLHSMITGQTYQDWIDAAVAKAGDKSKLAAKVRALLPPGLTFSVQSVQHLARRKPKKGKPARGSKFTVFIAEAAGIAPYGSDNVNVNNRMGSIGQTVATKPLLNVEITGEVEGMEYTRESLQIARWFMELKGATRQTFAMDIERAYLSEGRGKLDHEVGRHLPLPPLTPDPGGRRSKAKR